MTRIALDVHGLPVTQGSARAFVAGGRARITSDNKGLSDWRELVSFTARQEMDRVGWVTTDAPVTVSLNFWLKRPKSAPKTRDVWPKKGLDLDKLVRAVNDALTNAGVWVDDSRVCGSMEVKRYAVGPDLPKIYNEKEHWASPGVRIVVMTLGEEATRR